MDQGTTILFIDDDEISTFVNVKTIENAIIADNIITESSAVSALSFLKDQIKTGQNSLPDLIFLDINMPVMNGWQFLEEFKRIKSRFKRKIPIIVLTSSSYQKDKEKAYMYDEVDDYALKPLNIADLSQIKIKYLNNKT